MRVFLGEKKSPKIGGKFLRWLEKFRLNGILHLGGKKRFIGGKI